MSLFKLLKEKLGRVTAFQKKLIIFFVAFLLIAGGGWYGIQRKTPVSDPNILFTLEVHDTIQANYWEKISDQDLTNLFKKAADKITNQPQQLASNDKKGLTNMIKTASANMDAVQKKDFVKKLTAAVLANLAPFGRSALYTQKEEQQLANIVQNINPEKNLYQDLGVGKEASQEEIEQAYLKKEEELSKSASPEAKKELEKAAYAKQVLTDEENKKLYDEKKVEPTIFSETFDNVLYVYFKRFSPTTFEQFQKTLTLYDTGGVPTALILDFRGNIGGEIDAVPYYLGNFLGINQYAYDFYQQGDYKPFRTKLDKLAGLTRFKQVVILVDNATQSSAEIMAASLKSRRFGIVVGVPTRGWGTVERIFPIKNQIDGAEALSIFLVHHITVRDDGQPIEGRGVEPHVNINDQDWERQLDSYFRNQQLTRIVRQVWNTNSNQ